MSTPPLPLHEQGLSPAGLRFAIGMIDGFVDGHNAAVRHEAALKNAVEKARQMGRAPTLEDVLAVTPTGRRMRRKESPCPPPASSSPTTPAAGAPISTA